MRLRALGFCCALAVPMHAQVRAVEERDFIAFRYDADRVVIYLAEGERRPPPSEEFPEYIPEGSRCIARPLAKYPGPDLVEIDATSALTDRKGDSWTIEAAPGVTVTASVESLVFGGGACVGSYGVLARVDEASRDAFRAVKFRYHLARRGAAHTRVTGSALGELPVAGRTQRARVEQLIGRELAAAVRRVTDEMADYPHAGAAHLKQWRSWWRKADAALLRGEGRLGFDVQRFTLTPDGDPRVFVRSELRVAGHTAFLMSFWLREQGDTLIVERSDASAARHIRIGEYAGPHLFPLSHLGEILGMTDTDGDGWAEILMTSYGYELQRVTAYEYTTTGPHAIGASFEWGC